MSFLNHRVSELAWRLPLHMKIRGNEGKWAERLSGQRDHTASLWAVLMFQAWLESVN